MSSNATEHVPLVGSVFERKVGPKPVAPVRTHKSGFPTVQHRSKSAFSRARESQRNGAPSKLSHQVPIVKTASQEEDGNGRISLSDRAQTLDDWRRQVEEENQRKVESMTEEEREEEKREILERFGPNLVETLRKVKQVRETRETKHVEDGTSVAGDEPIPLVSKPDIVHEVKSPKPRPALRVTTPPPVITTSSTRPSSRADRRIRFADVTAEDVHVYESAPPSPRRKILALPAPAVSDGPTISLGEWKKSARIHTRVSSDLDASNFAAVNHKGEGTPEDIRRRFFPSAAPHAPELEWIESNALSSDSTLRFDLTGTPIPLSLSETLPTHLGLHHHADGTHAGYTLEDIFLLSRSTVPAQRANMLSMLSRIARKLARAEEGMDELLSQAASLRKRMLAAAVEAMAERGSVGVRAIELLWECIVGWDETAVLVEGVELAGVSISPPSQEAPSNESSNPNDPLSSLPLEYVLSQISSAFATRVFPTETLEQLLDVLHRLAQHTNALATSIITTPGLVANLMHTFLLTPMPPTDSSPLPSPLALQLLITLASATRENATATLGPADALLRFVTFLPADSPYPPSLASVLLSRTLRLYAVLASYGLYAHIATTAAEYFARVGQYARSEACRSTELRCAWLYLVEAWMVCARDPHRTTPGHEILWSQVVGWDWGEDVLEIRDRIDDGEADDAAKVWASVWKAEASWLEGAAVNGIRNGQEEKFVAVDTVREGYEGGTEKVIVQRSVARLINALDQLLIDKTAVSSSLLTEISLHGDVLASVLRFWLSCLPDQSQTVLEAPPFSLPFTALSELCAKIVTHPLWSSLYSGILPSNAYVCLRPLSMLLFSYVRLSRRMPGTSPDLWLAQALTIICRLLPGDEESGQLMITNINELINAELRVSRPWPVPSQLLEKGGMDVITPFLTFAVSSKSDTYLGPMWMSPKSIATATTQRLPSIASVTSRTRQETTFPLSMDWYISPLDLLLRSGQTDVFKTLPPSWDASETEIVRATLLFARIARKALLAHGLNSFLPSREEIVFTCMKVFMLEHGQQHSDSTDEVFRDGIVTQFMEALLAPFTLSRSSLSLLLPPPEQGILLDAVAIRFLGPSTPFYQYYTDFVALYDAISFSQPLFARLLLPPTSMRYPIDFRKYLWDDYGHVVRTVRTPVDAALAGSVGEYLWPAETDARMLAAYLRALVKDPLEGLVRLIAVHHIACTVWPDLREDEAGEEQAARMLKAVAAQGGFDVVREVVCYRQVKEGTVLLPPVCFEQVGSWRAARSDFVRRVGDDPLVERLKTLLM